MQEPRREEKTQSSSSGDGGNNNNNRITSNLYLIFILRVANNTPVHTAKTLHAHSIRIFRTVLLAWSFVSVFFTYKVPESLVIVTLLQSLTHHESVCVRLFASICLLL